MQRTTPSILINPFAMTADQAQLLQLLAEDYHQKSRKESAIGLVKRGARYAVTLPVLDFDVEPEQRHIKFTHDVRLQPPSLIDPTNLNETTRKLLLQLLTNKQSNDFLEASNPISRENVTYHLVTDHAGTANLNLLQLTHTLIRYASKKNADRVCYAVVKREAFAHGARHAIYLSKHTLHVRQHKNSYLDIDCKRKAARENYRVVKRPYLPADDRGQLKMTASGQLDRNEQNQRLQQEGTMLQHAAFFHSKPVIHSNSQSSPALIMRYVNGIELGAIYEQLSFQQRIKTAILIGEAIQALHACNIIHRDIKLENILVITDQHAAPINCILIDYELAHQPGAEMAFELAGTPGYLAPEILNADENGASFAADVYAYAVILHDYLFDPDEPIAPTHRAALDEICQRGLRENPAERAALPCLLTALRAIDAEHKPVVTKLACGHF